MGKTLKKHSKDKKRRSMKGGFWPFTSSDASSDNNWSLYDYLFGPRKKSPSADNSVASTASNTPSDSSTTSTEPTSDSDKPTTDAAAVVAADQQFGGKKKRKTRKSKKSQRKNK